MIYQDNFQRADLAVADITITREREKDADFTLPFLDLGNKYFCLDFIKYKTSYKKNSTFEKKTKKTSIIDIVTTSLLN